MWAWLVTASPLLIAFGAGSAANYVVAFLSRRRTERAAAADDVMAQIDALEKLASEYWAVDYSQPHPDRADFEQIVLETKILAGYGRLSRSVGELIEKISKPEPISDQLYQFKKAVCGSENFRVERRRAEPDRIDWIVRCGEHLRDMINEVKRSRHKLMP